MFQNLAQLKYKNINKDILVFLREKTKRTTKANMQSVLVSLIQESRGLIQKWGNSLVEADNYVFQILVGSESEDYERARIKQVTKNYNKYLKRIGEELNLPIKLTFGVARHSWATIMKNFGASDELVGDGLGHQNLSTTKYYLGSFEDKIRKQYQNKLLKF